MKVHRAAHSIATLCRVLEVSPQRVLRVAPTDRESAGVRGRLADGGD